MNELPHRFRESSFRKYEMFIHSAVEAWPAAVKALPNLFNVSQVTFACRCRDAIKSLATNKWDTTVNLLKFMTIADSLVVSERLDGSVLIGSKSGIANFATLTKSLALEAPAPEQTSEHIFTVSTEAEKTLLMELSSRRLLSPRLYFQGFTDDEVAQYQLNYDVALDKHDEKTYILI